MRRFFVTPEALKSDSVDLAGDELHHLRNVCRLEVGEEVELLDGAGVIATAKIETLGKKLAELRVLDRRSVAPPPAPLVKIVLCIPRLQKMELILQKCVELGAHSVQPVVSERAFLKKISSELTDKHERWERIVLEACKQSGRAWPMKLEKSGELSKMIRKAKPATSLFLYESATQTSVKAALTKMRSGGVPRELTVFIGAEGGFSPAELALFEAQGFAPVTMGSLVLRVETACIAILSVIQFEFDLLGS